jgi:hypothetical protein
VRDPSAVVVAPAEHGDVPGPDRSELLGRTIADLDGLSPVATKKVGDPHGNRAGNLRAVLTFQEPRVYRRR